MKIALLGTRGIPNNYGGFEQFAEYLAKGLVDKGHEVYVYNSHNHPYQESIWQGVHILHKYDPENKLGTAGQFIYDLNCIRDSRKRNFDIILQLGYTSSSIWGKLLPRRSLIITNMDGLEWKRSKYSKIVQQYLKFAEKLAIDTSHHLIADSKGIQKYLAETFAIDSVYIPYGANFFNAPNIAHLNKYGIKAYGYNMLIARLEPENSIETILEGVKKSSSDKPFLVIGNHGSKYGQYLKSKYSIDKRIIFLGTIYSIEVLNNIRYYSNIYFHGHTVGGTNPSLLEAMASQAIICAHANEFNSSILEEHAYYFKSAEEVAYHLDTVQKSDNHHPFIKANSLKIFNHYSWQKIINDYEAYMLTVSKALDR